MSLDTSAQLQRALSAAADIGTRPGPTILPANPIPSMQPAVSCTTHMLVSPFACSQTQQAVLHPSSSTNSSRLAVLRPKPITTPCTPYNGAILVTAGGRSSSDSSPDSVHSPPISPSSHSAIRASSRPHSPHSSSSSKTSPRPVVAALKTIASCSCITSSPRSPGSPASTTASTNSSSRRKLGLRSAHSCGPAFLSLEFVIGTADGEGSTDRAEGSSIRTDSSSTVGSVSPSGSNISRVLGSASSSSSSSSTPNKTASSRSSISSAAGGSSGSITGVGISLFGSNASSRCRASSSSSSRSSSSTPSKAATTTSRSSSPYGPVFLGLQRRSVSMSVELGSWDGCDNMHTISGWQQQAAPADGGRNSKGRTGAWLWTHSTPDTSARNAGSFSRWTWQRASRNTSTLSSSTDIVSSSSSGGGSIVRFLHQLWASQPDSSISSSNSRSTAPFSGPQPFCSSISSRRSSCVHSAAVSCVQTVAAAAVGDSVSNDVEPADSTPTAGHCGCLPLAVFRRWGKGVSASSSSASSSRAEGALGRIVSALKQKLKRASPASSMLEQFYSLPPAHSWFDGSNDRQLSPSATVIDNAGGSLLTPIAEGAGQAQPEPAVSPPRSAFSVLFASTTGPLICSCPDLSQPNGLCPLCAAFMARAK